MLIVASADANRENSDDGCTFRGDGVVFFEVFVGAVVMNHEEPCNDVTMGRIRRKIVQIAACAGAAYEPGVGSNYTSEVFALCNDGTLWLFDGLWRECKTIPQPKKEEVPS